MLALQVCAGISILIATTAGSIAGLIHVAAKHNALDLFRSSSMSKGES